MTNLSGDVGYVENVENSEKKKQKEKKSILSSWKKAFRKNWELYLLLTPVILYFLVFDYRKSMGRV